MRPDLGHVKDVPLVGFGILGIHDLDVNIPDGIVLGLDGLVQVLEQEVWILASYSGGFLLGEVFNTLLGLEVHFDVFKSTVLSSFLSARYSHLKRIPRVWYLFGELVGMSAVSVYLTERSRGSSVAEQVHKLMNTLGVTSVEARGLISPVYRVLGYFEPSLYILPKLLQVSAR